MSSQLLNEESGRDSGQANRNNVGDLACKQCLEVVLLNQGIVGLWYVPFPQFPSVSLLCRVVEVRIRVVLPRCLLLRATQLLPESTDVRKVRMSMALLTNAADAVVSASLQRCFFPRLIQIRTQKDKSAQLKNKAVAVLSQGPRF